MSHLVQPLLKFFRNVNSDWMSRERIVTKMSLMWTNLMNMVAELS